MSLGARAAKRGVRALEEILDAMLENDGHELLYFPVYNYCALDFAAVREMLVHPLALPGLADGGAHVGTICDASFPTFLLSHWCRDRATGRIPIERAVQMLASDTARHLGMRDRGELRVGLRADLNVIDHARLRLLRPKLVADLPAGGKRLLQGVEGYRATVVAGTVVAEDGRLTGARPGRLVRASSR
jgi:N-acyl-D-aspartate/D-glutamate deacylase